MSSVPGSYLSTATCFADKVYFDTDRSRITGSVRLIIDELPLAVAFGH